MKHMISQGEERSGCGKLYAQRKNAGGQAMLLAVLTLGATMLGATTIAGLLMLYQIRQATDFGSSARSIFAADAGTEWALYTYYKQGQSIPFPGAPSSFNNGTWSGTLGNGAVVSATCYSSAAVSPCDDATDTIEVVAKGSAGNTARAFLAAFAGIASPLP
jgi:hypothetical protein